MIGKEEIKAMIIINIIDNCNIEQDNTGQQKYTLNQDDFNKCVNTILNNIINLKKS